MHPADMLRPSTPQHNDQQPQGPWRPSAAELANLMAGSVPPAWQYAGVSQSANVLLATFIKEDERLVPDWFWQDEIKFDLQEMAILKDIGMGPPYRASYPGMSSVSFCELSRRCRILLTPARFPRRVRSRHT